MRSAANRRQRRPLPGLAPARALRRTFAGLLWLVAAPLLAVTLLAFAAPRTWLGDFGSFWHPHLATLALALALFALVLGRRILAAATCLALVAHLGVLLWPVPRSAPTGPGPALEVASFNVLFDNPEMGRLLDWLRREQPDIVLLQEASRPWLRALGAVDDLYPWRSDRLTGRPHGVVILSRRPITAIDWQRAAPRIPGLTFNTIALRAEIEVDGRTLSVIAAHPPTPRSAVSWRQRNLYLRSLARIVDELPADRPVLLAGDMNTPPTSAFFEDLLAATGLRDAAGSRWRQPTRVFKEFGLPPAFGVAIDDILVGPGVGVGAFTVGPDLGSDHRPVIARLTLPGK